MKQYVVDYGLFGVSEVMTDASLGRTRSVPFAGLTQEMGLAWPKVHTSPIPRATGGLNFRSCLSESPREKKASFTRGR